MQPKDVEAILRPFYDELQEICQSGNCDGALKFYHSQGVVVETDKRAFYGTEQIREMCKQYFEKVGPHKFCAQNQVYQGTDDYLCAKCDFEIHSEKGNHKGKVAHIWAKENGKWLIYHEEFDMN